MFSTVSYGQISPGKLSQAHANLEGMSNCTKCHDLGEKVSNKKCLDCHNEIQKLLNQKRGYHANSEVKNKDCFKCHSDHHGRKFDMVRFDEENFKHKLTGYNLEGKHEIIDCSKCHVADNIQNTKIKKRKNTFLGLEQECLSCHDDYHQKTLSTDCISCHGMDAFKPASKFDHNTANYKIKGKHKLVDCKECHETSNKNGKEFQKFNDIPFNDCKACHADPHNKQIKGKCEQCHTETSFSNFRGKGRFNHRTTNFILKGSHKKIDCFSCHKKTHNPKLVFQGIINVDENNCVSCHDDFHEGKFGNECAKCHIENSFLSLKSMDFFDHNKTDYNLKGKHLGVDCKQCHKGRFTKAIDFSACNNCHEDYHRGEFIKNGLSPDCNKCHSLEYGFDYSLFTLEQHQKTSFPLEGAHNATPCFACHVSEDRWTFKEIGTACIDCHQDIHQGYISKKYYPDNTCKSCHVNDNWSLVNFDHNHTTWPLKGKHLEVDCRECHFEMSENNTVLKQSFNNLERKCASCHENIHDNQFAINGETDCKRCHSNDSWFPENFNHDKTAFPLEGRHAEIACSECHKARIQNGKTKITYKIKRFECIDCHY
ncbi:MAG: cytochrome c family protein [Bacteroidetes bacterium]|nr:MAG: cytochrome c family protein [Bacteroidota bacterium]